MIDLPDNFEEMSFDEKYKWYLGERKRLRNKAKEYSKKGQPKMARGYRYIDSQLKLFWHNYQQSPI